MPTYRISNQISGHAFGCYKADNEAEALDKLAQDAGYADYAEACTVVGGRGNLLIEVIESDFPAGTRVEAGEGDDYDTGTVIDAKGEDARHPMAAGDNVLVAWGSSTRTWTPTSDLRRTDRGEDANPYLLTFWGGVTDRYRREHPTLEAAREEALRVLAELDNRGAHPAIIEGPNLGPDGITIP